MSVGIFRWTYYNSCHCRRYLMIAFVFKNHANMPTNWLIFGQNLLQLARLEDFKWKVSPWLVLAGEQTFQ